MFDWLYNLSDPLIALFIAGITFVAFLGAPLLLQRVFRVHVSDDTHESVTKAIGTVIGFTALVLAFSLVQAQGNLRAANDVVTGEGAQLNQLDRQLARYDTYQALAVRPKLLAYAQSIVTDEWPQMRVGHGSPVTQQLFTPASRLTFAIRPKSRRQNTIYAAMLGKLDDIADSRARRLDMSVVRLPPVFWKAIFAMVCVLLALAAFTDIKLGALLALAGQGLGIGLLISVVFIFDAPFKGDFAVTPDPIVHAVDAMRARTATIVPPPAPPVPGNHR